MDWDASFVEELASRRCIIFLGAGASAGSISLDGKTSPPSWEKLLKRLLDKVADGQDKNYASDLIAKAQYLDAAEVICGHLSAPDFAALLRSEFVAPKFQSSEIHKAILKIDPKVVITTNYDEIYDQYCVSGDAKDGYNVCRYYEPHLINDLRSPVRSIVKAHGCMADPSKIILTKSQYFRARQEYTNFFRLLDALFLTHTLFFVGYSLSDPDIQLLLENANITAPSAHPHYAVVHKDKLHPAIKAAASRSYNLRFIEYSGNGHDDLISSMHILADAVIDKRESNPAVGN